MTGFGASGPGKDLFGHFGFTAAAVVEAAESLLQHGRQLTMAIKVGINGYGRIGRNILRALYEAKRSGEIQIVAINDLGDAKTNAHLTRYDTAHGPFPGKVAVDGDHMVVNGDRIRVLAERDPAKLPWGELGVDIVLECTGLFASKEKAVEAPRRRREEGHRSRRRPTASTRPSSTASTTTCCASDMTVISNASCTTNCLAPLVKPLHDAHRRRVRDHDDGARLHQRPGADRRLSQDLRRARSATMSMIPTKTGAAAAVGLVLPELKGKLDGFAVRVPTINVSLVDLTFTAKRATTVEEVNGILRDAVGGRAEGHPRLHRRAAGLDRLQPRSGLAAPSTRTLTKVIGGTLVKVCSWYDNEWGFSNRMLDTTLAWARAG